MRRRVLATLYSLLAVSLFCRPALAQSPDIVVEALLPNTVVLKVGGERKTLRVGQSHGDITLLAADQKAATLEVNGVRQTVGMSQHISTNYTEVAEQRFTIPRDSRNQYNTTASINGRNVRVMVDTGASTIAISGVQAQALGIDYYMGEHMPVETASGLTNGYAVMLRSVSVGGIEVNNVPATVLEGNFPITILLGMTYLRHVRMEEQNGILSLSRVQ